jgi:hypothetical protein
MQFKGIFRMLYWLQMENNKSLELKGVHGTCQRKAESILQNGFKAGAGRHGTGVYVWTSNDTDHTYAIELALCYAEDKEQAGNKEVVALICDISTTHDNFLDLEEDTRSRLLTEYIRKHTNFLATAKQHQRKQRATKVIDDFVRLLEETSGLSYDVIHSQTQAPQSYRHKLSIAEKYLNMEKQGCYVVRNLDCIPQDKVKAA